jgi:hypothetical protein
MELTKNSKLKVPYNVQVSCRLKEAEILQDKEKTFILYSDEKKIENSNHIL